MLRIGKQQTSLRLPEMTAVPTTDDLGFLLSKAQRNWRCAVELPFKTADGLTSFIIIVKCEMGTGSPCWSLYRSDISGMPVVWSHISSDMLLIHNLISLECASVKKESGKGPTQIGKENNAIRDAALEMPMSQSRIMSTQLPSEALTQSRILSPKIDVDIQSEELDPAIIQSVEWALKRAETGIYTYSALLYFLHQEFARFQRGGQPFSLVVFDLFCRIDGLVDELPIPALREAFDRIASVKRTLDMIAHYEALEFAFLLPHTDVAGALIFAQKVQRTLLQQPLAAGLAPESVEIYFGIAGIPEDCQKPARLMTSAVQAKRAARESGATTYLYRDLVNRG